MQQCYDLIHFHPDFHLLESVQSNFTTKLVMRCSRLVYRFIPTSALDRRVVLTRHPLHSRRIKNDLVMAFKILTGRAPLKRECFFKFFSSHSRGAPAKMRACRCRVRSAFYSQTVVSSLTPLVAKEGLLLSLKSFKKLVAMTAQPSF